MSTRYDAIIIGTGQAGPSLAGRMNSAGMRVALIERDQIGGTCVNVGCTPTKALVASARAAHVARRAGDFGVLLDGPVSVDMVRVKARMKDIAGHSTRGLTSWLEGMQQVDLIRGDARFVGPHTIEVNGEKLQADKIFLNVGARPHVPEMPGLKEIPFLTSTSVMDLEQVPAHLIVIGGSYIGLEFGQIYRRFGSRVTIMERGSRLIKRDDPDVSTCVQEILESEGIDVRCNAECLSVAPHSEGVAVQTACDGDQAPVIGSHLLIAVGRTPNTDSLGLDRAGIETDSRGHILVDDQLCTNVSGVWALGDCNGRGAFTHTSYNDYEIVAANLFDDDPRRISDRILCYGLFIDPPLGRIGMTESQARASGRNVLIGKRLMSNVGRARERSETDGFIKILVDRDTKEILGAAILGIGGDEVVHSLLDVMYAKAPYTVISRAVHIHPTVSELIPTTLQSLVPLE
ncbi:MAG: pyruvate/2-oxoglutarate dehydrogenase complex dihydrolipoamide dehydrogenase (E3) component [Gammaproteobacteria bacterium]|jgi:pyruvate/2-oxoglutarate dehydrogenase complex dihydrolipoamide dehydrogenase (E3) component